MNTLFLFIGGVVFAILIVPAMQYISDILFTLAELAKTQIGIKLTKNNVIMNNLNKQMEEQQTHAIGFCGDLDEDEPPYWGDEDEQPEEYVEMTNKNNIEMKCHNKIGF